MIHTFCNKSNFCFKGKSHGLVVKGEDFQPRGQGFKSWCQILVEKRKKRKTNLGSGGHQQNI